MEYGDICTRRCNVDKVTEHALPEKEFLVTAATSSSEGKLSEWALFSSQRASHSYVHCSPAEGSEGLPGLE